MALIFQLTTSRRGRQCIAEVLETQSDFNSLPHAEVDGKNGALYNAKGISTHYLTQR